MKRRDFFEKSGCGLAGIIMSHFGLTSCAKKEEAPAAEAQSVKKMMMEKMGKTEEEAAAMIKEAEEKLPMLKDMCICKTCPTYVAEETEKGFCHVLVGKSKIITEEKGCDCPKCPVYQKMGLKNGYYCTRKSEMEQEMAKGM
jgi:hypothetical protein